MSIGFWLLLFLLIVAAVLYAKLSSPRYSIRGFPIKLLLHGSVDVPTASAVRNVIEFWNSRGPLFLVVPDEDESDVVLTFLLQEDPHLKAFPSKLEMVFNANYVSVNPEAFELVLTNELGRVIRTTSEYRG